MMRNDVVPIEEWFYESQIYSLRTYIDLIYLYSSYFQDVFRNIFFFMYRSPLRTL